MALRVVIGDIYPFFLSSIYDVKIIMSNRSIISFLRISRSLDTRHSPTIQGKQENKEFGQLSGEELLKPITKRLDSESTFQETRQESPEFTMDEFDVNNPFGVEFRPDAPTPQSSPPLPDDDDDDNDDDVLPRKEWGRRGRLSLNISMNQPYCRRLISRSQNREMTPST